MFDAGAVADDDGRAVIRLGLANGLERLGGIGTHGDLCDIHIAVAHGHQAEVLLLRDLAAGGELGDSRGSGGLGGLSAGVGVHLGIQHQHIDVLAGGQHMIQSAVADVIRPAVAAERPHGLLGQELFIIADELGLVALVAGHRRQQCIGSHAGLGGAFGLVDIVFAHIGGHALVGQRLRGGLELPLDGILPQQIAVGVLGVVLEQAHRPSGAAAVAVGAVGGAGGGTAVGGGAAGGIGDVHMVAEQLGHQLDIGRLAAARARAGELEVGLGELGGLDALIADGILLDGDGLHGVFPIRCLTKLALQRLHGQCLLPGGANIHAAAAARAVIGGNLHTILILSQTCGFLGLEARGSVLGLIFVQQHGADGGVGADEGALVALDALGHIPLGDIDRRAALFVLGGAGVPCAVLQAVLLHDGHGQAVALLAVHHIHDLADEVGSLALHGRVLGTRPCCGDGHLHQLVDAVLDGGIVHVHHGLTLFLVIGLIDGVLHLGHGLLQRDNLGQLEERGLQNGVGAAAQSQLAGDFDGVDGVELRLLLRQSALHGGREILLQTLGIPRAVQQEHAALLQVLHHVVLVDIGGVVAGHEIGGLNQIRGADGSLPEAQMALRQAAGLLGVVDEVRLTVEIRGMADDLDGVLVGTHRAVAAHAPELRAGLTVGRGVDVAGDGQGGVGHIVHDAHGEVVLGAVLLQVIQHGDDLAGGGILAAQAVAAAHDGHVAALRLVDGADVLIQRLAHSAGLLGAIQHRQLMAGRGHGGKELVGGEGAVQVDIQQSDLFTLGGQVVDGLLGRLGGAAHQHHHALGIGRTIIIKQPVLPARQLADCGHVVLHRIGNRRNLLVARLAALEEDVGVHGRAAGGGMLGVQRVAAEGAQRIHIHQRAQILVVECLDLLNLVAGAEAVEEMQERHTAVDGTQVCHRAQVHDLLRGGGCQQRKAGAAHAHHIAVVAEDGQRVGGQGAGGDMEHARQHFARDFIHIGDHQQQALRRGVGRRQRTGLQRAVYRAGRAALGLHLHHLHGLAEQVLLAVGGPLVHMLRHGRGRRDGENARHLRKCVGYIRGGFVAVHDDSFVFVHNLLSFVILAAQCRLWSLLSIITGFSADSQSRYANRHFTISYIPPLRRGYTLCGFPVSIRFYLFFTTRKAAVCTYCLICRSHRWGYKKS